MASMCDGQNREIQNYFRDQVDNIKQTDLVVGVCDFFHLLTGQFSSRESPALLNQLTDTLVEMVQGNEANQVDAFDHKVMR